MPDSLTQEKFWNKLYPPIIRGINETRKSGIKSNQVIFFILNLSGEPFLKNKEQILPLPKAHSFP